MYGTSQADINEAMQTLRDLGVATVIIDFSGGNDEGGADGAEFLDAEGDKVEVPSGHAYESREYTGNGYGNGYGPATWTVGETVDGRWVNRPATDDEIRASRLTRVIEAPIYDRWGTFAGEFYVQGTLTWDVAAGTHRLTGQERVESYEDFDY